MSVFVSVATAWSASVAFGCAASSDDECTSTACAEGDASSGSASASASSEGGDTSGAMSSSGADGGETTTDGGAEDTGTGGPPGQTCASAAVLRDVSLFQVVEVPLVQGCAEVDPTARRTIVADRVAVVRARIEASTLAAGTELALRLEIGDQVLTGSCVDVGGQASAPLLVDVPAGAVAADADYAVSVIDCAAPDVAALDGFPASGRADLGVDTMAPIRLHLVPFEVGGFVPDTSPAVIDGFRDAVLAMYPVADVQITVADVEPDDNGGQVDMGNLMFRLIALQEELVFASGDLDPSVADIYYYGLVTGAATREEFCDTCPTGTSESGVGDRAGSAVGAAFADALSESTLVHELGHMHGLLHSPCGDPSLQDDAFPHADGSTQTEGWDFRTGTFVPPDHHDLMGYCQPRWVSGYHYDKMVEWVHLAASWSGAGDVAPPPGAGRGAIACGH